MRFALLMTSVLAMNVSLFGHDTSASEPLQDGVPDRVLADIGLAALQPLSDKEGMKVRGMSNIVGPLGRSIVLGDVHLNEVNFVELKRPVNGLMLPSSSANGIIVAIGAPPNQRD